MRRLFLTCLTLILCVLLASAQTVKFWTVKGNVIDAQTGEALVRCNVALMNPDSVKMVRGASTADDGSFSLKFVNNGKYVVKVSYVGYRDRYISQEITDAVETHKLGTIRLIPANIELKEAEVTALLKEMEVKEDTIIFNAAAIKVAEGSMLEELIRKLPGFTVDDDGTLKHNGRPVKKILLGGKEFFGNDQNMAMKNIPTNAVEKVKVYDKQSDLTRLTGIDDGEEETVVDISIKKNMNKGWFGNLDVAYGTHDRYSGNASINRYAEDFQASLIGELNNTNSQTGGGGGRGANSGITTVRRVGLNMVKDFKNLEVGGNVRFSSTDNNTVRTTSSQEYVNSKAYSNSHNSNRNKRASVSGDFKIEWNIDSLTRVLFRPSFSFGKNESNSNGRSVSLSADPYQYDGIYDPLNQFEDIIDTAKVNDRYSYSWGDSKSYNYGGNLIFNRRLGGKPWFGEAAEKGAGGRNVSIRLRGSWDGTEGNNTNFSDITYYKKADVNHTFRSRNTPNSNSNYSVGFTYAEPILRNLFAQLNYSYGYSKRHSDGTTYDIPESDTLSWEYLTNLAASGYLPSNYYAFASDSLSKYTDNINYNHNLEFSFRYITELLNISAGVRLEQQKQKMEYNYLGRHFSPERNITHVSPTLNARLRFDRQHVLNLTYRGNTRQPGMTDMLAQVDSTNVQNIREGNPDLKPSFTNNVSVRYNRFFTEKKISINANANFSNTFNSITNRTEYNPTTGGVRTKSMNVDGDWSTSMNAGINTPLGWEKLTMNFNTSASYSNNVGYLYQQKTKETVENEVKHTSLNERLSFTLRLGDIDVRANGNFGWSKSTSASVEASNQITYNFRYSLSSTGNFQNGLGYSTDIGMSSRRGMSAASFNTNELIWNAQVSYRFLKGRNATISIQAYDILRQRSSVSRNISLERRSDSETNSINSYYMCHFIYRLNVFGGREARRGMRANRDFREGGDRPDFGGGRPGGGFGGGRGF